MKTVQLQAKYNINKPSHKLDITCASLSLCANDPFTVFT